MQKTYCVWMVALGLPLMAGEQVNVTGISLAPAELTFRAADESSHVLVTGTTAEGEKIDLTATAQFAPSEPVVKICDDGFIYPVRQGDTKVTVTAAGKQAQLSVHVNDLSKAPATSFIRDVEPVLNKVGCTA